MRENAFAWVCEFDDCGHRWLAKSEVAPDLCGKCRRRGWHVTKTIAELVRGPAKVAVQDVGLTESQVEAIARRVFAEEWSLIPAEVDDIEPVHVPDLTGAPLADKLAIARAALTEVDSKITVARALTSLSAITEPQELCGHEEPAGDTGSWALCRRPLGHKGDCGNWQVFDKTP